MDGELLHHLLEHSATRTPDAVALVQGGATTTYAQLAAGAGRIARLLVDGGVGPGDRVALLAPNGRFHVEGYYGASMAGAVVVPLNTAAPPAQLAQLQAHAGARALLCGSGLLRHVAKDGWQGLGPVALLVTEAPARLPALPSGVQHLVPSPDQDVAPLVVERSPDQLCSIVYTSGSTGAPLGACLSHRNLLHNTRAILAYLPITAAERAFVVLPFYYIFGTSVLNTHIAAGATLVLENNLMFLQTSLDTLEREACTSLSGVPSTFALLLHRSNFATRPLAHLRYAAQAGGAMSPSLTRQAQQALRGRDLYVMYGATEAAGRLSYLPPTRLDDALGSIGQAIQGVTLQVLRPDDGEAAVDEEGELVASGPCVMQGYWQAPAETAAVLDARGRLHTGDLARRDARGMLYVVGRLKDMIKSGAHRIAAREIEDAILEHEAVYEVAVLGVPDPILGEAIHAYVVPRGAPVDAQALRAFVSARLAAYKVPSVVVQRASLPKNEAGKILKQQLRQELGLV